LDATTRFGARGMAALPPVGVSEFGSI